MILVTGANGYLGRHLLPLLVRQGQPALGLVRNRNQVPPLLASNARFMLGDLLQPEALNIGLKLHSVKKIVHLAGVVDATKREAFEEANVRATANLIELAKQAQVELFVHVSSWDADRAEHSHYAKSKRDAEELVKNSGLPYVILRPTVIYGGSGKSLVHSLASLIRKLRIGPVIGSGEQKLQPIYVDDLCQIIAQEIAEPRLGTTHFVGGPQALSQNELVQTIANVFGIRSARVALPLTVVNLLKVLGLFSERFEIAHQKISFSAMDKTIAPDSPQILGTTDFAAGLRRIEGKAL